MHPECLNSTRGYFPLQPLWTEPNADVILKGTTVLVRNQVEVSPGIHIVPGAKWSRVYLIVDETLTLVDSGLPWHPRGILNYIRAIGRRPDELKHILVTHSHPDHVGGTLPLVKKTGAAVVTHRSDTKRDHGNKLHLGYTGLLGPAPTSIPLIGRTRVNRLIEDGDVLPLHGGIRVIHTPGHTRGSVCFLLEEGKILFSGDTIFSNGSSISRSVPFPGYDRKAYARSLKRLSEFKFVGVFGGHGSPMLQGGSYALRQLIESYPEPPKWGDFFSSVPRRLKRSFPMTGEYHFNPRR